MPGLGLRCCARLLSAVRSQGPRAMVLGAVRRRGCSEQQPFGAGTVQAGAGAERLPRARFLEQLRQERGPCVAGRQHCACEKDRGLLPGIRPDQPAAGKGRRASSGDNKTSMLLLKPESAARPSQTSIKRMKRFELSTLSLARRCSTTEPHPQICCTCDLLRLCFVLY